MILAVAAGMFSGSAMSAAADEATGASVYSVNVAADSARVKTGGTVRVSLDITSSDPAVATFNDADMKLTFDADNFTYDPMQSQTDEYDIDEEAGALIIRRLGTDVSLTDGAELILAFTASGEAVDDCVFDLVSAKIDLADNAETDAPDAVITNSPAVVSIQSSVPVFKKHSLLLSGQIGVNFYMDLPEIDGVDYADSYVEFTVNGINKTDPFDPEDRNAAGHYCFTCYVNSISMAQDITAVFCYGEDQTVTEEEPYSVAKYVEAFEEQKDDFDDETIALIESMADYGHYIQLFLDDVRSWTLGVDYAPMEWCFTDEYDFEAIRDDVEKYRIVRDPGTSGLEKITYSLYLDAETSVYVYLKPAGGYDGIVRVTENGQEVKTELMSDGRYRADIFNISAHRLGDTHNLQVETDNGTAKVDVSALSYVDSLLNAAAYADDTHARNAMAAFYEYYVAADAYKKKA